MSDFANLLGKLDHSAKQVASRTRKHYESDDESDKHTANKKQKVTGPKIFHPPSDAHKLTIKLSFLGIGAQKSGTSWLHEILNLNHDLSLPMYVSSIH